MKPPDQSTLLELAGERSFERGREYFLRGQALGFADRGDRAEALVLGTRAYRTELRREAERVLSNCDCPVGEAGGFCKHAVALGLRWLSGEDEEKSAAACERLIEYAISALRQGLFADWRRLGGPALDEMLQSQVGRESLELIVELTRSFRQSVESGIAIAAKQVKAGIVPELLSPAEAKSDCYFIEAGSAFEIQQLIVNAAKNLTMLSPIWTQWISPMKAARSS
jgi:uncharacterized Zn finger protein